MANKARFLHTRRVHSTDQLGRPLTSCNQSHAPPGNQPALRHFRPLERCIRGRLNLLLLESETGAVPRCPRSPFPVWPSRSVHRPIVTPCPEQ